MTNKRFLVLPLFLLGIWSIAFDGYAQAPVVDLSKSTEQEPLVSQSLEIDQDDPMPTRSSINHSVETVDQRVLRLEKQISNLTEMNYASKLEKLQQELQQLHGQIEVQTHDLTQLKEQVRNFYQDLDQRLSKEKSHQNSTSTKNTLNSENTSSATDETLASTSEANKTKELQTYEAAFNLLNKKDYTKAISGFQSFVKDYPDSAYTVNAHYWLGEIFYLKGKPEQANKEFQIIITNYPDNPKVADAMLKIALIEMDAENYTKAKQHLLKVQKQFPGTTAAKIATLRLKEIKQKK